MMVNKYYRNRKTGITASIKDKENGKAVLTIYNKETGKRTRKTYENAKSASDAMVLLQIMDV